MELPNKVTIAGIEIEVVPKHDLLNAIGMVDYENQKIYIDSDVGGDIMMQTYFHELIHYIFYVLGREELRKDEELIEGLSHLLYQAIK